MRDRLQRPGFLHLVAAMLAWLFGAALQSQQSGLWRETSYLVLGVAATLSMLVVALKCRPAQGETGWLRRATRASGPMLGVMALGVSALSFSSAGWRAVERAGQTLDPSFEGVDLVVTGVVATLARVSPEGMSFAFDIESAQQAGRDVRLPPTILLGWYHPRHADDPRVRSSVDPGAVRAAQRWRFTVKLKRPHGAMNPHGFDFELWAFERQLGATGSVRATGRNVLHAPTLLGMDRWRVIERARQAVKDRIEAQVPDRRLAGVLAALSVGDQSAIERGDWALFRDTGVAHLMSISGLHITMFAWLAAAACGWLWRRSPTASLAWPAPTAARVLGAMLAALYAAFSGWGVPAQRTVWMLAAVVLLQGTGRRWPWPLILLAAAVVVTLFDPWAMMQPGFWLSFVAVGILLASDGGPRRHDEPKPMAVGGESVTKTVVSTPIAGRPAPRIGHDDTTIWRRAFSWSADATRSGFRTQAIATVGLAPLSLFFFQQLSLVGFAANALAIPVVTLLVTPLALLGVLWPALWTVGAWVLQALSSWLSWLASVPWASWTVAVAPWWAQAAGLLAGVLAVSPVPWRLRAWSLVLAWPLLVPLPPRPPAGTFEAVVADVGQGTAVLLRTRHHVLLFDTGPMTSPERNAGERLLVPLLRARGESHIDMLMLSHRDSDHVGGAASVMQAVRVGHLSSSIADNHPLRAGVPSSLCVAGQAWRWDDVTFEVLHPRAEDLGAHVKSSNGVSCVLRVEDALGRSMLLTGDIETRQESEILARGASVHSDVLLAAHHGSKTSSSPAWLQAVAPSLALVQAGYRNRYGHPAPTVVQRFEAHGIELLRTDACGAWTRRPDASWHCERDVRRRFWHHAGAAPVRPAIPAEAEAEGVAEASMPPTPSP